MKCDHDAKRRCTWVGTVGTLQEHVAMCKFTLLPCPKECKDDSDKVKQFLRQDIDKHLEEDCPNRDYNCKYCGEKGTYTSITDIHDQTCPKKPVPCHNGCSVIVQRQHVLEHVTTECELTVIACKYKRLGCDRELKKKDMAAHEEDDKLHLRMAMDTTVNLKTKMVELENKTVELEDALTVLKNGELLKFILTNYQKKKENKDSVQSPPHYTSLNGYHMAISVCVNGIGAGKDTHVSAYASINEGAYDDQLKWPFIGKIVVKLLNQLEDKNHYQRIMNFEDEHNVQVGDKWGFEQFISHSALDYDAVNNTQYLKDNTLYLRMSVEPANNKPWLQ